MKKVIFLLLISMSLLLSCCAKKTEETSYTEMLLRKRADFYSTDDVSDFTVDEYHYDGQVYLETKYVSDWGDDVFYVDYLFVLIDNNGWSEVAKFPVKQGDNDEYSVYYEAFLIAKEKGTHRFYDADETEKMLK